MLFVVIALQALSRGFDNIKYFVAWLALGVSIIHVLPSGTKQQVW